MDIIENWNELNERMKNERPDLSKALFSIHMGMFDDLRSGGQIFSKNGHTIAEIAHNISAQERMNLAQEVGRNMIVGDGNLFEKTFKISNADFFPNCIFIVIAAIIENSEGSFNEVYPDKKMKINCIYETNRNDDPFGKIIPVLQLCYPWIALSVNCNSKNNALNSDNSQEKGKEKTVRKKGLFSKLFNKRNYFIV